MVAKRTFRALLRFVFCAALVCTGGCGALPYFMGLEPYGEGWDGSYVPFPAEYAYSCADLRAHLIGSPLFHVGSLRSSLPAIR